MQRIKAQKQDELELKRGNYLLVGNGRLIQGAGKNRNESSISNVHAVNIKSVLL